MDAMWGYVQSEACLLQAGQLLHKSVLPLVLDLDETLLVAYSQSQLERQIRSITAKL